MPPFKSYFSFHGFRNHCRKFFCSRTDLCSPPLDNVGSMTSLLKSRSVIRLRGPDTVKFLQGLVTNDVKRFAESPSESSYLITPNVPVLSVPPIYTAILTPQGRFLYDLFIYRPPRADEKLDSTGSGPGPAPDDGIITLLADVDTSVVDEILDCFKKYRLRSKVEIDNVAEEFYCWQRFGSALSNDVSSEEPDANAVGWGGSIDKAGVSSTQGNDFGWRWFRDPRLNSLGFRGIFPANMTPPLVESDKDIDEEYYLLWRLQKGVAEGSTEIPKGEAIPLEYNLVGLNAISFDKGCYVGQEFVARTHHRGVIRKRLIPLIFVDNSEKESQMKVAAGSEVVNSASGKKVGIITKTLGSRGMGLLKLEDSLEETSVLVIRGQDDVKVKIIWPEWWPEEWIQGET